MVCVLGVWAGYAGPNPSRKGVCVRNAARSARTHLRRKRLSKPLVHLRRGAPGPFQEFNYPVRCNGGLCPVMGVCAGLAGTDTLLTAVHRSAVRPDEQPCIGYPWTLALCEPKSRGVCGAALRAAPHTPLLAVVRAGFAGPDHPCEAETCSHVSGPRERHSAAWNIPKEIACQCAHQRPIARVLALVNAAQRPGVFLRN